MKKGLLSFCLLSLIFASCQKQNAISVKDTQNSVNSIVNPAQAEMAVFPKLTDPQIDSIGIYNNLFITQDIDDFVFNTRNDSIEMRADFTKILESNFVALANDSLANYFISFVDNPNASLDTLKSSLVNPQALTIVDSCIDFVEQSNITYAQILTFIDQEEKSASTVLNGNDRVTILTLLSILKNSCYLWMPVNIGGSGVGDSFINSLSSNHTGQGTLQPMVSQRAAKWAVVALADAESAAWMLSLPGGAGVYVAVVAGAAAVASGETLAAMD